MGEFVPLQQKYVTARNGDMLSAMELDAGGIATVWNHETAEQVGIESSFADAVVTMERIAQREG